MPVSSSLVAAPHTRCRTKVEMLGSGMVGARIDLTWGSLEFHRETLTNLQTAMMRARKLCCTMIDTMSRELMIRRDMNPEVRASHVPCLHVRACMCGPST